MPAARTSAILALLLASLAAGPAAAGTRVTTQGFEEGMGGWVPDHHIDCEQAPNPCRFVWQIERSSEQAHSGAFGLRGYLDGSNDDGTIWVERSLPTRRCARTRVTLSFWLWSRTRSDANTWPVVAHIGRREAEREHDFAIVGQTDSAAGWVRYARSRTLRTRTGVVHVAAGFGATWETPRTYFIDDVSVTVRTRRTAARRGCRSTTSRPRA